jgi:hypothetical protein
MKKYLIFVLSFLFLVNTSYTQQVIDTNLVCYNASLKFLLSESFALSKKDLTDFKNCNVKFLSTRGFKNVLLFEINFDSTKDDKFFLFEGIALFFYDIGMNKIFLLNGDSNIEKLRFLNNIYFSLLGTQLLNEEKFMESVYLEKIDSKKLYKYLKKKKKYNCISLTNLKFQEISTISYKK